MSAADYFPTGAYNDKNAPYNEESVPEMDFKVTVSQTLSKTVTVSTNDYIPGASGVDYETDDEGHSYAVPYQEDPDTSDTDWKAVFENCEFKIQDLLNELKRYVLSDLSMTGPNTGKGRYLRQLLEACDGWVEDDYEVSKD